MFASESWDPVTASPMWGAEAVRLFGYCVERFGPPSLYDPRPDGEATWVAQDLVWLERVHLVDEADARIAFSAAPLIGRGAAPDAEAVRDPTRAREVFVARCATPELSEAALQRATGAREGSVLHRYLAGTLGAFTQWWGRML